MTIGDRNWPPLARKGPWENARSSFGEIFRFIIFIIVLRFYFLLTNDDRWVTCLGWLALRYLQISRITYAWGCSASVARRVEIEVEVEAEIEASALVLVAGDDRLRRKHTRSAVGLVLASGVYACRQREKRTRACTFKSMCVLVHTGMLARTTWPTYHMPSSLTFAWVPEAKKDGAGLVHSEIRRFPDLFAGSRYDATED